MEAINIISRKKILAYSSMICLLLGINISHADEGWVSGVGVQYSYTSSKWVNAGDLSSTSIMSKVKGSYTYKSRMSKIVGLTTRQNQIMTTGDGSNKHYATITYTTAPNGASGFTRWYDSPYGVVIDYLTPYAPGTSANKISTDAVVANVSAAINEYNRVQFPNGNQTVYLAPNTGDLVDAKIGTAVMASKGQVIPLVLGDLSGTSFTSSAFSYVDQLKAKTIIMLGGTSLIEATSGLSSNYNVIRVGGANRLETENYLIALPSKTHTPSSYQGDGNGVVMQGISNSTVYNELVKLSQTQNINYLKTAVNAAFDAYGYMGSAPSTGQSPAVVLGVHNGDFETYWICYFYQKAEGRAVYQYVLPSYFPKISFSKSPSGWTSGNVNVTANISVDSKVGVVSKKWASGTRNASYFASSGNALPSNNIFTVTANDTYTVYVKDSYGNETVNTVTVSNIDRTAPYGSASVSNVSSSGFNVNVSGIGDSQSGVNRVEICAWRDGWDIDGKWYTNYVSSGSTSFRIDTSNYDNKAGNYTVAVRIYDNVGNGANPITHVGASVPYPSVFSSPIVISNHEYISGSVYWVQSGNAFTAKAYGYTNPNFSRYKITSEFILARAEGASGFGTFKALASFIPASLGNYSNYSDFKLSTNTYSTSLNLASGSYAVRTDGSWVDSYFNLTLSGDESVKLSPLIRVESEGQTLDSTWETNTVIVKSDSGAPTITLTPNPNKTWSNSNVTISVNVSDSRSGVRNWTVRRKIDNGSWINLSDKTTSVMLSEDGTHTVEVTAVDNVGNSTTNSISVKVDKTVPSIVLTPSTTNWTNQNINITANVTDNLSGISIKKWADGVRDIAFFASNGTSLGSSFTVTGNNTYTVYAKDNAGNESVKTIVIGKIDKVNPTITGDFDNDWSKGSKTINFATKDDLSGIFSIKLWNENKTTVLKNGNVSNGEGSLSHVITEEGITKYNIESIDNANNLTNLGVIVRIDNTAPTATATLPSISNNRNITISLSNIVDTQSGVKEAWVSESASFDSGVTKTSLIGLTSKQFTFNLGAKETFDSHFSVRNVYIRVYDNVGNYNTYIKNVKLVPVNPLVPSFNLPTEDALYVKGEQISLHWDYESVDVDLGRLPQIKAEITLVHKGGLSDGSDVIYKYTVEGDVFELPIYDLDFGDYEATVKVFNFVNPEIYTESKVLTFRYNKFKTDGNVFTENIVTSSPIKYLSISTKYELPKNSNIEGFVYYEKNGLNTFDLSKYIKFKLSSENNIKDIIELPKKVNEVKIQYILTRSSIDKFTSPILDHIIVLAR